MNKPSRPDSVDVAALHSSLLDLAVFLFQSSVSAVQKHRDADRACQCCVEGERER